MLYTRKQQDLLCSKGWRAKRVKWSPEWLRSKPRRGRYLFYPHFTGWNSIACPVATAHRLGNGMWLVARRKERVWASNWPPPHLIVPIQQGMVLLQTDYQSVIFILPFLDKRAFALELRFAFEQLFSSLGMHSSCLELLVKIQPPSTASRSPGRVGPRALSAFNKHQIDSNTRICNSHWETVF